MFQEKVPKINLNVKRSIRNVYYIVYYILTYLLFIKAL